MSNERTLSSATLIVLGDSLEPSAVTKLLSMRPSQQWRRGEQKRLLRKDGTIQRLDSVHQWGGWKRWSSAHERKKEFEAMLEHWCRKLSPKKKALSRLRSAGCKAYLDCCLASDSGQFSLPPSLLAKLASLGVTFRVSFYPSDDEPQKRSK